MYKCYSCIYIIYAYRGLEVHLLESIHFRIFYTAKLLFQAIYQFYRLLSTVHKHPMLATLDVSIFLIWASLTGERYLIF